MAAPAVVLLVVQEVPADVGEGVGAAGGGTCGRVRRPRRGCGRGVGRWRAVRRFRGRGWRRAASGRPGCGTGAGPGRVRVWGRGGRWRSRARRPWRWRRHAPTTRPGSAPSPSRGRRTTPRCRGRGWRRSLRPGRWRARRRARRRRSRGGGRACGPGPLWRRRAGRGMAARSVSQAVMEVAPSSSHSPVWSWVATASLMRASSRSRSPKTAVRAAPSAGMSSWSMAVPSSSNIPAIVHLFAYPNQARTPAQRPFSGRNWRRRQPGERPSSRGQGRPQAGGSEPLTPAYPNPPQPPQSPRPRPPGRGLPAIVDNAEARTPNPTRQAHQAASRRTASGWGRSRQHRA